MESERLAAAFHESGHAVATLWAFRTAPWLPHPRPRRPVRYIELLDTQTESGACVAADIYPASASLDCIVPRFRDLMELQVVIHLSGGLAEAIFRGERRPSEVLRFAELHCCMDADLEKAKFALGDLRRLMDYRFEPRDFVDRTMEMLLAHWPAVDALAEALIEHGRIEGEDVVAIIDAA